LLLGSVDERVYAAAQELRASRGLGDARNAREAAVVAAELATKLAALLHRSAEAST
jgi:hypothetical protein